MKSLTQVMKKILSIVMIIAIVGNISVCAVASDLGDSTITDNDVDALSELMDLYGYGGECISVRPLLNSDNQEQYLLAVSENGHLIVERDDYRFCQCGEGNPYAGHEDQTCY